MFRFDFQFLPLNLYHPDAAARNGFYSTPYPHADAANLRHTATVLGR